MAKGNFTATGSSALLVAADVNREFLTIIKTNTGNVAYLGIGEAAVSGSGLVLQSIGDRVRLTGHAARQAIYVIGASCTGTYQDLDCDYHPGSYPGT